MARRDSPCWSKENGEVHFQDMGASCGTKDNSAHGPRRGLEDGLFLFLHLSPKIASFSLL